MVRAAPLSVVSRRARFFLPMKPLAALRLRGCSDEQLVARFRAGDDSAYAQIADRYRDRLRRYAGNMLRTRSADVAEDVVQDVFLRGPLG